MCHAKIFQDLVQFKIIFLASMSKKLKRKQPTLAAFGFTKKVVHRGEEVAVNMPLETIEVLIRCDHCEKLFKSEQGLSFHKKVMHGSSNNSSVTISQPTKPNDDELLSLAVEDVVNKVVNKVVSTEAKRDGAAKMAGKKRHQYPATFKAEAISTCENGVVQETVAEWFGITQSQVSRWLKNKASIMEDATNSHRKLFKKGRKATKYLQLYDSLFKEFLLARSKGHIVNFGCL